MTSCWIFPALHISACGRRVRLIQTGDLSYWSRRESGFVAESQSLNIIWPFKWKNRALALWHFIPHLSFRAWALFSSSSCSLCARLHSMWRWRWTDSDSGGNGRQAGTSEAGLFSNKRGDQTCSWPVKENIILVNSRTGWCRRIRVCFVPIWSSSAMALIWFRCGKLKTNVQLLMHHQSWIFRFFFLCCLFLYQFCLHQKQQNSHFPHK